MDRGFHSVRPAASDVQNTFKKYFENNKTLQ